MQINTIEEDGIRKRYREIDAEIKALFNEKDDLMSRKDTMSIEEFRKELNRIDEAIDFAYRGFN